MVSIVIPIYNSEKYLEKCINSIIKQNYTDWEIVAVDDGSTDKSLDILNGYLKMYSDNMKVYHQENKGVSVARNVALEMVEGEYVTFLDSDDYIAEDYLQVLVNTAIEFRSDMVASGEVRLTENGEIVSTIRFKVNKNGECDLMRLNITGKIYRKDFLDKYNIRFAEGKIYEDNPFNIKCYALARNLKIIDYIGYYQVVHLGSTTTRNICTGKLPFDMLEDTIRYVIDNKERVNDFDLFQYTVLSFFTYFIFKANKQHYYLKIDGRKSSNEIVCLICDRFTDLVNTYFDNYTKCKYLRVFGNKGVSIVQSLGVYMYVWLTKHNKLKQFVKFYYFL